MEQADAFGKTDKGKRIYAWRKETIERSFAEAKELHGLRYASMLGIRSMYEQSFLTAAVHETHRQGVSSSEKPLILGRAGVSCVLRTLATLAKNAAA